MERTIKKHYQIGYSQIDFETQNINGENLDTKVIINDQLLIVIAGNTLNEFHEELKTLIEKYRI